MWWKRSNGHAGSDQGDQGTANGCSISVVALMLDWLPECVTSARHLGAMQHTKWPPQVHIVPYVSWWYFAVAGLFWLEVPHRETGSCRSCCRLSTPKSEFSKHLPLSIQTCTVRRSTSTLRCAWLETCSDAKRARTHQFVLSLLRPCLKAQSAPLDDDVQIKDDLVVRELLPLVIDHRYWLDTILVPQTCHICHDGTCNLTAYLQMMLSVLQKRQWSDGLTTITLMCNLIA